MQFRVIFLLPALASAASSMEIGVNSKLGSKLLASARRLNDNQDERDFTWAAGYSIRFKSCHTITTLPAGQGNNNKNNGQGLYNNNIVVFQLCPTGTCGTDNCADGAEYAIGMNYFVDAYTEAKMEREQQVCENIRENCYCDNANDDQACENQCYLNEAADYCVQYEDDEEFEVQRYLQDEGCQQMEGGNNNNNNNNGNNQGYFIGAYCASSGDAVYLGVFDDASCVNHAEDGLYLYEKYMYRSLPYSKQSLVGDDCVSCQQVDENQNNNNNNNNNNNQEVKISEMCEGMYQGSAKCETNLVVSSYNNNNNNNGNNNQYWYPDEKACDFINNILPKFDKVFSSSSSGKSSSMKSAAGGNGPAKAFAWVFGFSTLALVGVCYWLYTKVQRTSVDLSSQGGTTA